MFTPSFFSVICILHFAQRSGGKQIEKAQKQLYVCRCCLAQKNDKNKYIWDERKDNNIFTG
jgi:hypothetical protein